MIIKRVSGNLLWQVLRITSKRSVRQKVAEEMNALKGFCFRVFRETYSLESVREDLSPYAVVTIIANNCIPSSFCPNLPPLDRIKGWYYQQEEALYTPAKDDTMDIDKETSISYPTFNGFSLIR